MAYTTRKTVNRRRRLNLNYVVPEWTMDQGINLEIYKLLIPKLVDQIAGRNIKTSLEKHNQQRLRRKTGRG